ncbi:MAG TPA: zinc metallopeptidase [Rhodothermales bacterium]|nr:zinc metallopeptidase [Rhodothermales bacterium]HRR10193.1 zinc metallopeptidase [Rhodothermales bacterium]
MLLYALFFGAPMLLALWAQFKVKSTFNKFAKVPTRGGMTGAEVARAVLDAAGLYNVKVEPTNGFLSDHYDPRGKVLRLSEATYNERSVSAAGVAAHEAGHALQDKEQYTPLVWRSAMVPAVQFGSMLGPIAIMAGLAINITGLAWLGIVLFAAASVFSLVTLPVEFDASNRAKAMLAKMNIVTTQEGEGVDKVLDAAALTYVAAAVASVAQLLYYVLLLTGRRD